MIVILTVFSLFAGLACGFFGLGETVFSALRNNTDLILYVLCLLYTSTEVNGLF